MEKIIEIMKSTCSCLNDNCGDKCQFYQEKENCQFKLIDAILESLNIEKEDYLAWLTCQVKEDKTFWKNGN